MGLRWGLDQGRDQEIDQGSDQEIDQGPDHDPGIMMYFLDRSLDLFLDLAKKL